jgi:RimJ/RimL family protein N-acetyltransferase
MLQPMDTAAAERVVARTPGPEDRWAQGYPADGDVAGARGFLGTFASKGDPRPFGAYQIILRDSSQIIGTLGFHGPADDTGTVAIGYGLIPSARGRGFASEALRALLAFARTRGITSVVGITSHDNVASQHVMMAAGMELAAENEQLKHYKVALTDSPG